MAGRTVVRTVGGIGLALALALATAVAVHAVLDWMPAETANVSRSGEARNVALAVGSNQKAVAWWVNVQTGERRGDLVLAQNSGTGWVTQTVTTTLEARWPFLVYSDTTLYLAWFQGQLYTQPATALGGWVWEGEPGGLLRQVTGTLFYGVDGVRPHLRVGPDGVHMVFAAAITSTRASRGDLYYLHRSPSGPWFSTILVTSDQFAASGSGGVFYPDLALTGGQVHLVWEQLSQAGQAVTYTIFYVSATVGSAEPVWATPMQLSPPQENGQRPAVAADGSGRVHVVWTDYITDTEQYVRYRRLDSTGWSAVQTVSEGLLRVNKIRPTVVWPAIAAQGDQVCVAWHGYYPNATTEAEEIYLRCSHDGGQTWGTVMNVSRSPELLSLMPSIAVGANGTVHVVWEEFQGGTSSYFYNYDALYAAGPPEVHVVFLPIVLRNR